jgi:DNA-binding XRE family transcriptional regulator
LEDCKKLGDHLKRRRLQLVLRQIDAAPLLGADNLTLGNWEKGKTEPLVQYYPAIMAFLGYCPYQCGNTFGRKLRLHRTHQGLSQRALARQIGVDPDTVSRWESGEWRPDKRTLGKVRQFLGGAFINPRLD